TLSREKLSFRATLVKHHIDVKVARIPRIEKQISSKILEVCRESVTQKVQRRTQRRSPTLVPTSIASSMTAAIPSPTRDPVSTTPGAALATVTVIYLHFDFGWVLLEKGSIVCYLQVSLLSLNFQSMRERKVAELEVVSVCLTIGRDVDHRSTISGVLNHLDQKLAGPQDFFKGDRL